MWEKCFRDENWFGVSEASVLNELSDPYADPEHLVKDAKRSGYIIHTTFAMYRFRIEEDTVNINEFYATMWPTYEEVNDPKGLYADFLADEEKEHKAEHKRAMDLAAWEGAVNDSKHFQLMLDALDTDWTRENYHDLLGLIADETELPVDDVAEIVERLLG